MLEVLEPGLFTTVQDLGRPALAHYGIRHAGAADRLALAASCLLAGEPAGSAALEMTLLGATFAVRADCLVGIAGADMGIEVRDEGHSLPPGGSYRLRAGTTLTCGAALDGARTYLALGGGIRADRVLGSASTDTSAALGGLDGRPLRTGDILESARGPFPAVDERRWPPGMASSGVRLAAEPPVIAVTRGPHADRLGAGVIEGLGEAAWIVSARSDRVGVRLDGPRLPVTDDGSGDLVSLPMIVGAVQVPPDGSPIVLSVDAPTIGGYPVAAVVIEADLPVLGQLRPGDEVRFAWVDAETARRRSGAATEALEAAARLLAAGTP
jgi:antagonist of KipI